MCLKECWNIYTTENKEITWFHKLAALKLARECNESLFKLVSEGPSVIYVKILEERLAHQLTQKDINAAREWISSTFSAKTNA